MALISFLCDMGMSTWVIEFEGHSQWATEEGKDVCPFILNGLLPIKWKRGTTGAFSFYLQTKTSLKNTLQLYFLISLILTDWPRTPGIFGYLLILHAKEETRLQNLIGCVELWTTWKPDFWHVLCRLASNLAHSRHAWESLLHICISLI